MSQVRSASTSTTTSASTPDGSEPRRAVNMRARRRRILDAAQQLIFSDGLPALSMRRLAAEAGVSVMTVYNLVGSKHDLLEAMIGDAVDDIDARLDAEAPTDADPFGRCCAVITVSIEHFAARPSLYQPMFAAMVEQLAAGEPDRRQVSTRAIRMQEAGLVAAIDQGLLRPETDAEALASQIFHGYEWAAIQWATGQLTARQFRARALCGLWITLLAACHDQHRATLQGHLESAIAELDPLTADHDDLTTATPA